MSEPSRIMIVMPHPDDAEWRTGGSAARWAKEGKEIVYVITTNGDKGSSDPDTDQAEFVKLREREQRTAADVTGVGEVIFLGLPDQGLEDNDECRKAIVRQIRKYKPDMVITTDPHRGYLNHRDHRMNALITLEAVYPYAGCPHSYPELLEEGLEAHRVKEVLFSGTEDPNYFVDITDTMEAKLAALRCHESQGGGRPGNEAMIRERDAVWAKEPGQEYMESFHREEMPWQPFQ
ncbi:PIG-L deacetylase family protein [Chloroflexota bacterium]